MRNKIRKALINKSPFVVYKKGINACVSGCFQKDSSTYYSDKINKKGYVFAPFDDSSEVLIIPFDRADRFEFRLSSTKVEFNSTEILSEDNIDQKEHVKLVKKGVDLIKKSSVRKVVLARKKIVERLNLDVVQTFELLCEKYPNAYVYLWYHPVTGIWMGATPEKLLSVNNNIFKIMALASTQEFKGSIEVDWGQKEKEEHQFVVDFIANKIRKFNIEVSDTYTVKAGSLLHLRADIKGVLPTDLESLNPLIESLHPTPATCGLPKNEAKEFILKNERFDREYYTGYLGEFDSSKVDLYVNLRCMKVEDRKVSIFVGGGITQDSNPEKEWQETVAKTKVMQAVL